MHEVRMGEFSAHVGKPLHGLGEFLNGLVGVAVLDAVPHAVLDVTFQHDLPTLVQGGFGSVDLGENILAGDVLVHHAVNGLYLTDDLFQTAVQVVGIHALLHKNLHTDGCISIVSFILPAFGKKSSQAGFGVFCTFSALECGKAERKGSYETPLDRIAVGTLGGAGGLCGGSGAAGQSGGASAAAGAAGTDTGGCRADGLGRVAALGRTARSAAAGAAAGTRPAL